MNLGSLASCQNPVQLTDKSVKLSNGTCSGRGDHSHYHHGGRQGEVNWWSVTRTQWHTRCTAFCLQRKMILGRRKLIRDKRRQKRCCLNFSSWRRGGGVFLPTTLEGTSGLVLLHRNEGVAYSWRTLKYGLIRGRWHGGTKWYNWSSSVEMIILWTSNPKLITEWGTPIGQLDI